MAKRRSSGFMNFVGSLAFHFCLALPAAFTQPGDHLLAEPCTLINLKLTHLWEHAEEEEAEPDDVERLEDGDDEELVPGKIMINLDYD